MFCSIRGCTCTDSNSKHVQFFEYPKVGSVFDKWCEVTKSDEKKIQQSTGLICSKHFSDEDFNTELKITSRGVSFVRELKNEAVPSLMLPDENCQSENTISYSSIKTLSELEELRKKNAELEKKRKEIQDNILRKSMSLEKKEHHLSLMNAALKNSKKHKKEISLQKQKEILSKIFSPSQLKQLSGTKKTNWSSDDMATAYIIRHLGNERCYNYLMKNFFPLPAFSSVRRWITQKKI